MRGKGRREKKKDSYWERKTGILKARKVQNDSKKGI